MIRDKIIPLDGLTHDILRRLGITFDITTNNNFQFAKVSERDHKRITAYMKVVRGNK